MRITEELSPNIAKSLVELIFKSDSWLLSPLEDGCFDSKEEALE